MKITLKFFLITIVIISTILFFGYCILNLLLEEDFNRFNYTSSKKETVKFLRTNKKQLEAISNELYKNKNLKSKPYKNIRYSTYHDDSDFFFSKKAKYIQFDMDAQGFLGGQYYGLIYSKDKNIYDDKDLFIYDENKETGKGNNIFIRQKIVNHWYFYYNDYDGKVNIKEIKK